MTLLIQKNNDIYRCENNKYFNDIEISTYRQLNITEFNKNRN